MNWLWHSVQGSRTLWVTGLVDRLRCRRSCGATSTWKSRMIALKGWAGSRACHGAAWRHSTLAVYEGGGA